MDAERQKVRARLRELRELLEGQERLLLGRLETLEREIVRRQERSIGGLAERILSVSRLIQELEEKCQRGPLELLQVRAERPREITGMAAKIILNRVK